MGFPMFSHFSMAFITGTFTRPGLPIYRFQWSPDVPIKHPPSRQNKQPLLMRKIGGAACTRAGDEVRDTKLNLCPLVNFHITMERSTMFQWVNYGKHVQSVESKSRVINFDMLSGVQLYKFPKHWALRGLQPSSRSPRCSRSVWSFHTPGSIRAAGHEKTLRIHWSLGILQGRLENVELVTWTHQVALKVL